MKIRISIYFAFSLIVCLQGCGDTICGPLSEEKELAIKQFNLDYTDELVAEYVPCEFSVVLIHQIDTSLLSHEILDAVHPFLVDNSQGVKKWSRADILRDREKIGYIAYSVIHKSFRYNELSGSAH